MKFSFVVVLSRETSCFGSTVERRSTCVSICGCACVFIDRYFTVDTTNYKTSTHAPVTPFEYTPFGCTQSVVVFYSVSLCIRNWRSGYHICRYCNCQWVCFFCISLERYLCFVFTQVCLHKDITDLSFQQIITTLIVLMVKGPSLFQQKQKNSITLTCNHSFLSGESICG